MASSHATGKDEALPFPTPLVYLRFKARLAIQCPDCFAARLDRTTETPRSAFDCGQVDPF